MPAGIRTTMYHTILTPKELNDELDAEFHFDHDPCPCSTKDWDDDRLSMSDSGGKMIASVDSGLHTS